MRQLRTLTVIATTTLTIGALAACGGGAADDLSYEDSPLSEYMSSLYDAEMSPEDQQAELDAQERKQEEAVAACMQDEGFEYVPATGTSQMYMADDDEWDPDSRDWVEQYGYGVFSTPWDDEESAGEEEAADDPNAEYTESLSESELAAYNETLYGDEPSEEQMEDPDFDWNSLDQGCYGEAMDEAYDADALDALYEEFEPLMTKMTELYDVALSTDAQVALDAEWASCMEGKDFAEFTSRDEAQSSVYEKQDELYTAQNEASEQIDWESVTDEEAEALMAESDPAGSPEWVEAQENEVELALADLECRKKTDYDSKTLANQFELEEQFIADNKAELEAFRAAAEQVM